MRAPVFWRAHGARKRAIRELLRRQTVDSTASLRTMRYNQPRAAATARKSHARALHARSNKLARAWGARA
eukprot:6971197-Lingulodinium_polyedra.AAC.1